MLVTIHPEEMLPTERAALVAYWLVKGEALTVDQVVEIAGYQRKREARRLLQALARVLPIYKRDGHWEVCELQELV